MYHCETKIVIVLWREVFYDGNVFIEAFSKKLAEARSLISLKINFAGNNITSVGARSFANAFQRGNYPTEEFDINFFGTRIGLTGALTVATMLFII